MSFVNIYKKLDPVKTAPHCILCSCFLLVGCVGYFDTLSVQDKGAGIQLGGGNGNETPTVQVNTSMVQVREAGSLMHYTVVPVFKINASPTVQD